MNNVRINLESSFVLSLSDSGGNLNVNPASVPEFLVTPPSPPPANLHTSRRRRQSSSSRGSVGGPYLTGDALVGRGQRSGPYLMEDELLLTPPSPTTSNLPATSRRRRSSSGRGAAGGPYLTGYGPVGRGQRSDGRRVRTRGGVRPRGSARGRVSNVDLLLRDEGIPILSDRICKTCEMDYEDPSDITHCGKCKRKLHMSCYNGDGCKNCNYDPND